MGINLPKMTVATITLSKDVRESAYITIVRPRLEYASAEWDPHTKEHISKIEIVQRRAAR